VPPERPTTGYTPNELGRLLRVSPDRIRRWIAAGELGAINTAPSRLSKPRFIVLPHHLAEFERSRAAAAPKPAVRRRRRAEVKEGRCASRRLTRCRRMVKPFRPAAARHSTVQRFLGHQRRDFPCPEPLCTGSTTT